MTLTDPAASASPNPVRAARLAVPALPTRPQTLRHQSVLPHEQPPVRHQPRREPVDTRAGAPVLDIAIPVFNEENVLEESLRRLHGHLTDSFPHTFRITVADNASTDNTLKIAERLARELPELSVIRFSESGRGNALRHVWLASSSPVLAYMEADLSTDLSALAPLLAPLISGHSDLAIGTRLARTSRVTRRPWREFVSRSYNSLLHASMGTHVSDAQCGFKAIRADVAHQVLPYTKDNAWFFDTELLIVAERCGLRIHEVPVDWTDDPNASVDVVRTAVADVRGMVRLTRELASGRIPLEQLRAALSRGPVPPPAPQNSTLGRLPRQAARAVAWTAAYVLLFLLGRSFLDPQPANIAALVATALATRQRFEGLAGLGIRLALTSGALALLPLITTPDRWLEGAAVVGASLAASVIRFLLFRRTLAPDVT
ncbi:dolichyl-phosphate beta-glucosyltransferase [Paenarthrobacter sp. NPDC056912]|uniref:dolichyl-phosphate beta-glucosyltransferase n=1 Tax=Paenarthrobacter sp. NPDC056912 TaxID=3345965 RepID=UPI00366F29B3